jgi:acylphosphatase
MNNNKRYGSTKFEVSGLVQGVFFRKFTKAKAIELGLTGWCRNTLRGTVEGEYEYEMTEDDGDGRCKLVSPYRESVAEFRHWLCKIGSPNSRIDGCGFSEEVVSITRRFDSFSVVR